MLAAITALALFFSFLAAFYGYLFCWLPFLRALPPAMRGEAGAFFVWMVGISWLALCGGVYFLRNARSAWRLLFCANLLAALFFGLTA